MTEITELVNTYVESFIKKEKLRKQTTDATKEMKEAHEKLKDEMSKADLRIIRSLSSGYDIKLYQKVKKPTASAKNLKKIMEKHNIDQDILAAILSETLTGSETVQKMIKLIPISKATKEPPAIG